MQHGHDGIFLGWFDRVSLVRAVIETNPGEDWVRHIDVHYFEQSQQARTNPKTILWSPDVLDDVDAMNLWSSVHEQEYEKARANST